MYMKLKNHFHFSHCVQQWTPAEHRHQILQTSIWNLNFDPRNHNFITEHIRGVRRITPTPCVGGKLF